MNKTRPNDYEGWIIFDQFKRPMGSLGEYLKNQETICSNSSCGPYNYVITLLHTPLKVRSLVQNTSTDPLKHPRLTGNNQYEDFEKKFTMNDVPSGEELFDAIKCNIHGQVKGFYKVSFNQNFQCLQSV